MWNKNLAADASDSYVDGGVYRARLRDWQATFGAALGAGAAGRRAADFPTAGWPAQRQPFSYSS